MKTDALLHASRLTHGFSGRLLFSDLNISLGSGDITILRGDNGSGKTTLLRMLAGLIPPLAGQVNIDGVAISKDRIRAAARMVFIGHRDGLAAELTAGEAIRLWAHSRGVRPDAGMLTAGFDCLGLRGCMTQPVRVLSAGQRRRCGMVRLALIDSMEMNAAMPLWLLDEPTTAMDKTAVETFARLVSRHADRGGCILMTSHLDLPLAAARQVMLDDLCHTGDAA